MLISRVRNFDLKKVYGLGTSFVVQGQIYFLILLVNYFLGKAALAEFSYLYSTALLISVVFTFGTNISLQNEIAARSDTSKDKLFGIISSVFTFYVGYLPFFLISFISMYFFGWCDFISILDWIFIFSYGLFSLGFAIMFSILQGLSLFKSNFFLVLVSSVISIVLSLVLSLRYPRSFQYIFLIAFNVVYIAVTVVKYANWINSYISWFEFGRFKSFFSRGLKLITFKCIPTFLSSFILVFAVWYVNFYLSNTRNAIENLAFFSLGNTIRSMVLFVPMSFMSVIMTEMAILSENQNELQSSLKRRTHQIFFISIATLLILFINLPIFKWLFGKDFTSDEFIMFFIMMGFASATQSLNLATGVWFFVKSKVWLALLLNLIWLLFFILSLNILYHYTLSLNSVPVAFIISYILLYIISIFAIKKENKLQ
jgi:O-antigen/teichoic acid export membrane protein